MLATRNAGHTDLPKEEGFCPADAAGSLANWVRDKRPNPTIVEGHAVDVLERLIADTPTMHGAVSSMAAEFYRESA
ncbi:MAG: hypothetical protein QF637_01345 [Acidimicrobiales bacterium]|jgi:hypothetical protein|nr:hypothetical protein [Acidimicrobiales bacterium]